MRSRRRRGGTVGSGGQDILDLLQDAVYAFNMDDVSTLREFHKRRNARLHAEAEARRRAFEAELPRLVEGILTVDPAVRSVTLFGSLARPDKIPVRDIDIALDSPQFLRAAAWLLRQDLPIDVVDLHELYPNIRERVEREGRILYERK